MGKKKRKPKPTNKHLCGLDISNSGVNVQYVLVHV